MSRIARALWFLLWNRRSAISSRIDGLDARRVAKASNDELEMRWISAWSDLYEIMGRPEDIPCQLPDWSIVTPAARRGLLQDSAYEGYHVRVEAGWVGDRRGIIAHHWRETDD